MYGRSLLVLRALTDRRSGATIAGARDGWAYVWPRDAATVAIALAAAGHRAEARRIVGFLEGLDLDAAARFDTTGTRRRPLRPRATPPAGSPRPQAAVGMPDPTGERSPGGERADYQEKSPGDYLGNALAAGAETRHPLEVRESPGVWSRVPTTPAPISTPRPPGRSVPSPVPPSSRPRAERCCGSLPSAAASESPPREDWPDDDPWTAPTAWCAWSLAALGERRPALALMATLRRAATPVGAAAGAGRRPDGHPALDDPAGLVARLRDPRPARPLALTRSPPYSRTMEARPATLEDCAALARGMKVVVDEGRWLATEPSAAPARTSSSGSASRSNRDEHHSSSWSRTAR